MESNLHRTSVREQPYKFRSSVAAIIIANSPTPQNEQPRRYLGLLQSNQGDFSRPTTSRSTSRLVVYRWLRLQVLNHSVLGPSQLSAELQRWRQQAWARVRTFPRPYRQLDVAKPPRIASRQASPVHGNAVCQSQSWDAYAEYVAWLFPRYHLTSRTRQSQAHY